MTDAQKPLTPKQAQFCAEYMVDLNATQAAIRAGYSEKTAQEQSSRLLSNVMVRARIDQAVSVRAEKLSIDADWVLRRLVSISDRCMQAEAVMVFSPLAKAMVHKEDEEGNKLYEFDSAGANRATEMVGKHIGFFKEDNEQGKPAPVVIVQTTILPAGARIASSEKDVEL